MKRRGFLFTILAALGALTGCHAAGQERTAPADASLAQGTPTVAARFVPPPKPAWSQPENTRKPWVKRWWWPGSAVDKENLTRQLEELARVGIGGVEITPIYGARRYEKRYIDFLTPEFMAMLEHMAREARRLGLGVDMATGTGWPFGGPWMTSATRWPRPSCAMEGSPVSPPAMMVKRAAPGGEGLVVNPFSPEALRAYLAPFDAAFAGFPAGLVRGQFHDSFEYYKATWAPLLPEVFREMHGYDIQDYAAELNG